MSDDEIWDTVETGTKEDDIEVLNKRRNEVDSDLEVAIEEQKNRVDVGEVYMSLAICDDVCWQAKKIKEKKILKRLRKVMLIVDIWKDIIAIAETGQRKRTGRNNITY